jgi:alcohol dehydrogenase (NADP+)
LAVQYAQAWGCDPVVFSFNASKEDDAKKLGAKEFYIIPSSPDGKLDVDKGVDVLLLCGGTLPDFQMYVLFT